MFEQFLNIGIGFHSSRLDELRQRSINIFSLAFILIMTASMIIRIIGEEYYVVFVTIFSILAMLSTYYFSIINKFNYSIIISCLVPILLIIVVALNNKLSCVNLIGPLILVMAVFLIIIRSETIRWIFLVCSLILLFWIGIRYENSFLFTLSLTTQVLGIAIGFIFFVRYLEFQDGELSKAIESEKSVNKRLKVKNEDLKTFSHIMAHDLKSPIRHIKGFSQLIKKKSENLDNDVLEYLRIIENSSLEMEYLIEDILKLQKIEELKAKEDVVDLNKLLETLSNSFTINSNNKLLYEDLHQIYGDENLVKTVFKNIVSNSFKYQPKDVKNHIPTVQITSKKDNKNTIVTIKDNGIGISKEFSEVVFEPFKRLHSSKDYEGTGLGLFICKKILQKLGGSIRIIHSNNKGTTFELYFKA